MRTAEPLCTLCVETSRTELIGTELGTVMCQICLVRNELEDNISVSMEEDGMVIVAGSNPEGSWY